MKNEVKFKALMATILPLVGDLMPKNTDRERLSCRANNPIKVVELKRLAQEKRERKALAKAKRIAK